MSPPAPHHFWISPPPPPPPPHPPKKLAFLFLEIAMGRPVGRAPSLFLRRHTPHPRQVPPPAPELHSAPPFLAFLRAPPLRSYGAPPLSPPQSFLLFSIVPVTFEKKGPFRSLSPPQKTARKSCVGIPRRDALSSAGNPTFLVSAPPAPPPPLHRFFDDRPAAPPLFPGIGSIPPSPPLRVFSGRGRRASSLPRACIFCAPATRDGTPIGYPPPRRPPPPLFSIPLPLSLEPTRSRSDHQIGPPEAFLSTNLSRRTPPPLLTPPDSHTSTLFSHLRCRPDEPERSRTATRRGRWKPSAR